MGLGLKRISSSRWGGKLRLLLTLNRLNSRRINTLKWANVTWLDVMKWCFKCSFVKSFRGSWKHFISARSANRDGQCKHDLNKEVESLVLPSFKHIISWLFDKILKIFSIFADLAREVFLFSRTFLTQKFKQIPKLHFDSESWVNQADNSSKFQ